VLEYLASAESDGYVTGDALQLDSRINVVFRVRIKMQLAADDDSKRLDNCKKHNVASSNLPYCLQRSSGNANGKFVFYFFQKSPQ